MLFTVLNEADSFAVQCSHAVHNEASFVVQCNLAIHNEADNLITRTQSCSYIYDLWPYVSRYSFVIHNDVYNLAISSSVTMYTV